MTEEEKKKWLKTARGYTPQRYAEELPDSLLYALASVEAIPEEEIKGYMHKPKIMHKARTRKQSPTKS